MILNTIANVINTLADIFILVVIADSILSYFVDPYNPIRNLLDRVVNPFLYPIRRVVPPLGMFDISPILLIIIVEIVSSIFIRIL